MNNVSDWRCLGSSIKLENDLQLGSRVGVCESESETKPFIPNAPPGFPVNANVILSPYSCYSNQQESQVEYEYSGGLRMPTDYAKDYWVCERGMEMDQRERFFNAFSCGNAGTGVMPELALGGHIMPMVQDLKSESHGVVNESVVPETCVETERSQDNVQSKLPEKRNEPYVTKQNGRVTKRFKRQPTKSVDVVVNGITVDISRIPTPVCSCTGTPLQCYRWGSEGWQSACCTTMLSAYPLPMRTNPKRVGTRIAGRKMSLGAFKKVLEKLASENYDFSNAIDLKTHWARHGTNKYITFRFVLNLVAALYLLVVWNIRSLLCLRKFAPQRQTTYI